MNKYNFKAAILDMDGVITQTAELHAKAWKQMFDDFLGKIQGPDYKPMDIKGDYYSFIDGIPRHDGIRNFLQSRNLKLPEGNPGDPPERDSVFGLGARKNNLFLAMLEKEGVQAYEDTLYALNKWKDAGIKLAVISSSRNCKRIIETAGISQLFNARVDGEMLTEEKLRGKPEPDIFLRAVSILDTPVDKAIVLEDSIEGVKAGVKGKFRLVIGVARDKDKKLLQEAGAGLVIKDLYELFDQPESLKFNDLVNSIRDLNS